VDAGLVVSRIFHFEEIIAKFFKNYIDIDGHDAGHAITPNAGALKFKAVNPPDVFYAFLAKGIQGLNSSHMSLKHWRDKEFRVSFESLCHPGINEDNAWRSTELTAALIELAHLARQIKGCDVEEGIDAVTNERSYLSIRIP